MTDPIALEVHPALGTARRMRKSLTPLPAYVSRTHDAELAQYMRQAVEGTSAAAVLVGDSFTGKTRAAWEAVRLLPDHWRIWHPIFPARPEAVLHGLADVAPHTVVWLNDSQHYLNTASSPLGEQVAAGLRELLRTGDRGPVLVLGTLWPEHWTELTYVPPPDRDTDPHAQARALLTGRDVRVPDFFSDADIQALAVLARRDPRLGWALAHAEQRQITQCLAGAPVLLDRYQSAGPAARALLTAAMDLVRIGHGRELPYPLLEAAAHSYITDQQFDRLPREWLNDAFAYVSQPLRGARGALARVRTRRHVPATPASPVFRLADYLEHHGKETRGTEPVPEALWRALIDHGCHDDLPRLAQAAADRGLLAIAVQMYAVAARAGAVSSAEEAGRLLAESGRVDEALVWYEYAAACGAPAALRLAAWQLAEVQRVDEAFGCLQRAAEAGEPGAWMQAAAMFLKAARSEEAHVVLRAAVQPGDAEGASTAAGMLREAGRIDEALTWYDRATNTGQPDAALTAAGMLREAGRIDEALALLQPLVQKADSAALRFTASVLHTAGRLDDAVALLRQAAQQAGLDYRWDVAWLLEDAGRIDEAVDALAQGLGPADPDAMRQTASLLQSAGRTDEALAYLQQAVDAGADSAHRVAWLLEEAGRLDEALDALQLVMRPDDPEMLIQAAEMLSEAGRIDEALERYDRAADAGDSRAPLLAGHMLAEAGRLDESLHRYRRAVDEGDREALEYVVSVLHEAGRTDEAAAVLVDSARDADPGFRRHAAEMLEVIGRVEEALAMARPDGTEASPVQLRYLARLFARIGRTEQALNCHWRAAGLGDAGAWPAAVELLRAVGDHERATRLARFGWNTDGTIARPWHAPSPTGDRP